MQASEVTRPSPTDRYRLRSYVSFFRRPIQGELVLDAEVMPAGGAPALTVVAPVPGGLVNVTQKSSAMLLLGALTTKRRTYELDGGLASLDYTQGVLARQTAWRWASGVGRMADGTPFGFNLIQGFNDSSPAANENAFWMGSRLSPLGRARFEYNREDVSRPLVRGHQRRSTRASTSNPSTLTASSRTFESSIAALSKCSVHFRAASKSTASASRSNPPPG